MEGNKHTPEPWTSPHYEDTEKIQIIIHGVLKSFDLKEEDAARIVACVNACAGADNPQEYLDSARAAVALGVKLKVENDQLKARLNETLGTLARVRDYMSKAGIDSENAPIFNAVIAAIAEKGAQP